MKITAKHIKLALMEYFRFKRQLICATECLNGDVVVFHDDVVHEIEVKISKSDLWRGEALKNKHKQLGNDDLHKRWHLPNKFSVAVPLMFRV